MSTQPDAPALPVINSALYEATGEVSTNNVHSGLTAREHAAIALRVPDSGNDWLDAMIRTAQRNELAARAHVPWDAVADTFNIARGRRPNVEEAAEYCAQLRFIFADAMLSGAATQIAEGE